MSDYVEHVIREAPDKPCESWEELAGRMMELLKGYIEWGVLAMDMGLTQFDDMEEKLEKLEEMASTDIKAWRQLQTRGLRE